MSDKQFITSEGLKNLEQELETLKARRREIAGRIEDAVKLGDISENAEYHEAKEAQALNEAQIADMESTIKHAEIITEEPSKGKGKKEKVVVGSTITIVSDSGKREYTIVGSSEANPIKGLISNESPLGEAFLGHAKGDTVAVETPSGTVEYKITDIQ